MESTAVDNENNQFFDAPEYSPRHLNTIDEEPKNNESRIILPVTPPYCDQREVDEDTYQYDNWDMNETPNNIVNKDPRENKSELNMSDTDDDVFKTVGEESSDENYEDEEERSERLPPQTNLQNVTHSYNLRSL